MDEWKEAIDEWYRKNGLGAPRDHDTPSVSDCSTLTARDALKHFGLLGPAQQMSMRGPNPFTPHLFRRKPRLTAADIVWLRDMRVGL